MSDVLDVDPEVVEAAVARFNGAGDGLAAVLSQLRSVLAECGDMFGDDEQGRAFAEGYLCRAASIDAALALGGSAVHRTGGAVLTMAKRFAELEDVNTRKAASCELPR